MKKTMIVAAVSAMLVLLLASGCAQTTRANLNTQKASGTDAANVSMPTTAADRTTCKGDSDTDYALVEAALSQILTQDAWTQGGSTARFDASPATATQTGTVTDPMAAIEAQMATLMGPGVQLNYDGSSFKQYSDITLQLHQGDGAAQDAKLSGFKLDAGYLGGKYASYSANIAVGGATGTLSVAPNAQDEYELTVSGTALEGTWTCPIYQLLIGYSNTNPTEF